MATLETNKATGAKYLNHYIEVQYAELRPKDVDVEDLSDYKIRIEYGICYDTFRTKIFWYPEFQFQDGYLQIIPTATRVSGRIVANVLYPGDTDETEIDIDVEIGQGKIQSVVDNADPDNPGYGPHTVNITIEWDAEYRKPFCKEAIVYFAK